MSDYFICPNCGAEVPSKALSCPECGSDEQTGWSEDTLYDGLDLPDWNEPTDPGAPSLFQSRNFMLVVAIIAILIFLAVYIL